MNKPEDIKIQDYLDYLGIGLESLPWATPKKLIELGETITEVNKSINHLNCALILMGCKDYQKVSDTVIQKASRGSE